jgi:hypothetical protein
VAGAKTPKNLCEKPNQKSPQRNNIVISPGFAPESPFRGA